VFDGVYVKVGSGVSVGWEVKVSVGGNVGCSEAVSDGEGSGLVVQVDSTSGSGVGWINVVNVPHPIDKNVIARRTKAQRDVLSLSKDGNLMIDEIYTEARNCFGLVPSQC